jgi:hypothetical protein
MARTDTRTARSTRAKKKPARSRSRPAATTTRDREAATVAPEYQYCSAQPRPQRALPAEVASDLGRSGAILRGAAKWVNHTVIHYAFFSGKGSWATPKRQADVIRAAFEQWKALGIGLEFVEVTDLDEAEVRIGFLQGDGSWSYVGTDVLGIPVDQRTMSFGWDLTANDYGLTTALHEIGHTLGLPHEHQNPFSGIVWDEDAVYRELGGPPNNWPRETTFHNVLRKLAATDVEGSTWDPDSIMEYAFPAGLIVEPAAYSQGIDPPGTISPIDAEWARRWYPGDAPAERPLVPLTSVDVELNAEEQADFVLRPPATRKYTIGTFGASDTLLTLFEDVDGEPRFLAADDDSGTDLNASITQRLRRGRTYHVRVRLYYPGASGRTAVMYW